MEETKSGLGWLGLVIIFVLLFAVFGGGFGGFGFGRREGWGYGDCGATNYGFQNYKATCDAEKAEIINSATTQFKIVDTAAATRSAITADGEATRAKIDFYAYQDLRDKLSEAQRANMMLQNQLYSDAKFNALQTQLSSIQCNMLRRPDITGIGAVCPNAAIINGLGLNTLNSCGCGCGVA